MRIILDASSYINLIQGQIFSQVSSLAGYSYYMGPLVEKECSDDTNVLDTLFTKGLITRVDDSDIPASHFLQILQQYSLGEGETECLTLCGVDTNYVMACDDKKARDTAKLLYSSTRLTGSIGLVKACVKQGLISSKDAFATYELMKREGGFLPEIPKNFFAT